jgi:hypothetical protein
MVVFNEGPITAIKKLLVPLANVKEFLMVVSSNNRSYSYVWGYAP